MSHSSRTDEELISEALEGHQLAFREIVIRYQNQVGKTVISMLGNNQEAEDVGQEVFVRFYKSMPNFKGEAALSTYLTRIAINLSLNELKRRKRRFLLFDSLDSDLGSKQSEAVAPTEDRVLKEKIERAILELNPKLRSVIVLRLVDGYSTKETAEILGVPLGTVLSRLTRGQLKLREILKREL